MDARYRLAFLCLILAQAAHSIEEYTARLYEVFAPARFVSSLFSNNLALGFVIFNFLVVAFGMWCWAVPFRERWRAVRGFALFWILLEFGNGAGHLILALDRGGYFPGTATAPLLVAGAVWLAFLSRVPRRKTFGLQSRSDTLN